MNEKIIFVRTESGEDEARGRTALLSKDIKRALLMVDGTASVAEIMKRSSPSLRSMLQDMFIELARGSYIQDKSRVVRSPQLVAPQAASPKKPDVGVEELDFTAAFRVPTSAMMAEEAARLAREKDRVEAEAQAARQKAGEEAARLKAEQAAFAAAQVASAQAREEAQKAAVRAGIEAEQEHARIRAEEQAKAARVKAESVAHELAERVKVEQETARVVAQARSQLDAEVARLKAEAAAHARQEIETAQRLAAEEA
ncbi:MAG: hypothetical protein WCK93_12945, partial [Nitrosomonadales bacterium]